MKVLLVDDNVALRHQIAEQLFANGFEVEQADNGLSGLNKAKSSSFDIVVTDFKMPIIDGVKLSENLINDLNYQAQQILILTTDTSAQAIFNIEKLKLEWLAKPVEFEQILAAIQHADEGAAA
ncbi:response regulator [Catenovulum sediminis]|uniref:Response regulator n=1 Tax=Catenovulum sediminis TaxID=1740262 RepID=A0ABV1RES3_9ALTE